MSHLGYRPSLDGVRAFAILSVLAFHSSISFAHGGFLGVDLFFVLSGFLITTLLLDEHRLADTILLGRFWARRALRLLPALVLVLVVVSVWSALSARVPRPLTWRAALGVFFYAADYLRGYRIVDLGQMDHAWSLSIEEQFYLLWPPILLLLLRRRVSPRVIVALVLVAAAASATARALLYDGHDVHRIYSCFDTRADALLIGCAAALLESGGVIPSCRTGHGVITGLALAAGALFAVLITSTRIASPFYYRDAGLTLVAVAAALVVLATARPTPLARLFALPPLVWIGKISYGLYLWHFPAFHFIGGEGMPSAVAFGLRLGLTFALATTSFYLVERPILRLKARFSSATSRQSAA